MPGDFFGLPIFNLTNPYVRLEYLAEAGPRIVRLFLGDSDHNILAEMPEITWGTPYGDYWIRGGHRLWHAPEAFPRTYIPDNDGLVVENIEGGVRLIQPTEVETGIGKSIEIRLSGDRPAVHLRHELKNNGPTPVTLAPWAITQFPLGGVVIMPQQIDPLDETGRLPNRHLVLWPYTRWQDPRLELHDDFILLHGNAQRPPCKVGYLNRQGWSGYLRSGFFFLKRFDAPVSESYPDYGCNTEFYCNHQFVEVESLGTLGEIAPGQAVHHTETWEIYHTPAIPESYEGVLALVKSLNLEI
ncbi:MAG: hypothetical protein EHM70_16520 [Chloroflexota bacterium]|nr:MAG: hypothetical protein EHM70_16520 [Chloroflexota bacterium]